MRALFLHEVSGSIWSLRRGHARALGQGKDCVKDKADARCAINRFVKSPKCYVCGAATSGIFNKAEKILAKMEEKNRRKREARGEQDETADVDGGIQFGGPDSDDEGEGGEIEAAGGADSGEDED